MVSIAPGVKIRLSELLRSPTQIATVLLGDSPTGDGTACSRVVLTNELAEDLEIRFRQVSSPGMFQVLDYHTAKENLQK